MERIKSFALSFIRDEEAATMVEYALMLALIAIVCIVAVTAIGENANIVFDNIAGELNKVPGGGGAP